MLTYADVCRWVFHYSYQDASLSSPVVVEVLPTK
jgi:hypothetical protein